MHTCPLCGKSVVENQRFCNQCGMPLVRPVETRVLPESLSQFRPIQPARHSVQTSLKSAMHVFDLLHEKNECPVCNEEAYDGQHFCNHCGSPLTTEALSTIFQPHVGAQVSAAYVSTAYASKPGQSLIPVDPWRFSYPTAKKDFAGDSRAIDGLTNTIRLDPYPGKTNAIQDEIDALLAAGKLRYGDGHWYCCPWSPEYIVQASSVIVHGKPYYQGQSFVFHISAEDMPKGTPFFCDLINGPFQSTEAVEFCSPRVKEDED